MSIASLRQRRSNNANTYSYDDRYAATQCCQDILPTTNLPQAEQVNESCPTSGITSENPELLLLMTEVTARV
jgi:hypothetical protein